MKFRPKEDEVYFCENEEYGIMYSRKNKSFSKISFEQVIKLRELKNQELHDLNLNRSSQFDASKLTRVELIMSTACNLKCNYCFANGGNYNQEINNIPFLVIDKIIELITNSKNIQEIILFGGEPTLAEKEIEYLCKNLEQKGKFLKYKMVTNLYRISDHLIDVIKKYNIILTVSLDGPEWVNNKNRIARNGGNVYQNVINNIKQLKIKGVNIKAIEATYTSAHIEAGIKKEELKKFFNETFKVEDIYIVDDLNNNENNLDQEIKNFFQKKELEVSDRYFLSNYFLKTTKKCGICNSGISSICIDPQGYVYPCHLYVNQNYNYALGNILIGKIEEFKELYKIREKLGCYNCSAKYSCNICLAHILMNNLPIKDICKKVKGENEILVYKMYEYLDTNNLQN